jgi:hypothetical protein
MTAKYSYRKLSNSEEEEDLSFGERDNDDTETHESRSALARYRRLRLSSPAQWKAATRRAKLVVNSIKKSRLPGQSLIALGKLIMAELKEKTHVEPSVTNVRDAITAMVFDPADRDKAFLFYDKLIRLYEIFKRNRNNVKKMMQK